MGRKNYAKTDQWYWYKTEVVINTIGIYRNRKQANSSALN